MPRSAAELEAALRFLGIYDGETRADLAVGFEAPNVDAAEVEALIAARLAARKPATSRRADRIRDELAAMGVAARRTRKIRPSATGDDRHHLGGAGG